MEGELAECVWADLGLEVNCQSPVSYQAQSEIGPEWLGCSVALRILTWWCLPWQCLDGGLNCSELVWHCGCCSSTICLNSISVCCRILSSFTVFMLCILDCLLISLVMSGVVSLPALCVTIEGYTRHFFVVTILLNSALFSFQNESHLIYFAMHWLKNWQLLNSYICGEKCLFKNYVNEKA